jgi:hypothetical protein
MKKLLVLALGLGLIVAVGTNNVGAQQLPAPGLSALVVIGAFVLSFNETGQATIQLAGGAPTPLTGTLQGDPATPAGPGQSVALTYLLPEPVIAGDVSFTEPGALTASDWLRFTDNAGHHNGEATGAGSRMLFYSEVEPGETNAELADQTFPTNLGSGANTLARLEVGVEGNNGFDYRPGNVPFPQNNEYIGISDAVPEPATLLLMGSGLLGLAGWRRYSSRG